mgnify:CR=1 FL=1
MGSSAGASEEALWELSSWLWELPEAGASPVWQPASISRELMLVKVKYNRNNRRDIMEICNILKAQIVDMSKYQMMIQICDVPDRVQLFLKMLNSISIVEVARTGTVALQKCHDQEN